MTFIRQKLAPLQCECDPKSCSGCGRPSARLQQCVKCKVAKYCGKDCQRKDWKIKHKRHCKELIRLQAILPEEETDVTLEDNESTVAVVQELYAVKCGKSWPVALASMLNPKVCSWNDMFVFTGTIMEGVFEKNIFSMYDSTGYKIDSHQIGITEWIKDMCICCTARSVFLAVSIAMDEDATLDDYSDRIDFYKALTLSKGPSYSYISEPDTIDKLDFFDERFLVYKYKEDLVEEFDVSEFPMKPTGHRIRVGVDVIKMCAMFQRGQKTLIIQYMDKYSYYAMTFLDYNGRQMWTLGGLFQMPIQFCRFHPEYICTDRKGHIFAANPAGCRVAVINKDLDQMQTLLLIGPYVKCVSWNEAKERLYVVHANEKRTHLITSQYKIHKTKV